MVYDPRIRAGIFAGESGGDYNALFGYQNRPDGRFSNVNLTSMPISDVLAFTDPSGPYAQYVKGQVGRVATPVGAYQVVGSTLREAVNALGIDPSTPFTPATQDRIGQWILENQGTGAWEGYQPNAQPTTQTSTSGATAMPMTPQQPQGILGSLGIQKQDPAAADQTALPFYQRDRFKDTMGNLAMAFNELRMNPSQAIPQAVQANRERRQTTAAGNRTIEWLAQQPGGEAYVQMIQAGGNPAAVLQAYQTRQNEIASAASNPNVQSVQSLPDGGAVYYMKDGSIIVRDVSGNQLTGQDAQDYVRAAQAYGADLERSIYASRETGRLETQADLGAAAEGAKASGGLTIERGFEAYDQAVKAGESLSIIDDAINAIDQGAQSGVVYNMLPNVTQASASLENAMNRMGLNVISSVTFGALSEGEMRLAMETAVPQNLAPADLRAWLVAKRDAQAKARDALINAARYLTQPGNTVSGWLDQQAQGQGAEQPAPATTSVPTIRFDAEGNRIQ
jgi:hypothetical protein